MALKFEIFNSFKFQSISSGDFEPETEADGDTDGYEEVGKKAEKPEKEKKPARPSALQLIEPNQGPSRTLWSEVPEVIQSGMLSKCCTLISFNEKC